MVSTQIGKRLSPRNSRLCFVVVVLIYAVFLQVDAGGKPVLFQEATITETLISTDCDKFDCSILSFGADDSSAHFTTGFMYQLYNSLQEIFKVTNGFLSNQNRYALIYDWSLQPLNQQSQYVRFLG